MKQAPEWLWWLLFAALCSLGAYLGGCVKPLPKPAPPPHGIPICPSIVTPVVRGICVGAYTPDGYACVRCEGPVAGCIAKVEQVYCVGVGGCGLDPICGMDAANHTQ